MKRIFYPTDFKSVIALLLVLFSSHWAMAQFTITGTVETPSGFKTQGLPILVTGTENKLVYTDDSGNYSFTLQAGGAYEIHPISCEENPLNGVTTYDRVLIEEFLVNGANLTNPYANIAADLDNSNAVTVQDVDLMVQLIDGLIPDIPNGNNRFVLKNYVFPDPANPFSPAFPEAFSIANLQSDLSGINFIQIKKGDVNGTAVDYFICNGNANFPSIIAGKVFQDQNDDCIADITEVGMPGWKIKAFDGSGTHYYGTTNVHGVYQIGLLPGTYDVVLSNSEGLWGGCPDTLFGVQVNGPIANGIDFGLRPVVYCPVMSVDLSTMLLRRCFENQYKVSYGNSGTIEASNAQIEIDFDPFFNIQSSSIPWSDVNGNTYTFNIGDVPPGAVGSFNVQFELSCDAVLGQTHCSEARIKPDSACMGPQFWGGATLRVKGKCDGNEVKFTILNQGADMQIASNYIVVEDIVVMAPPANNPFILASGNTEIITVPANGSTWRLEADQASGYPWGEVASATVEGCGTNANGEFSLGFVNQFPADDQSPVVDVDCRENVGSFDPNDKQGFPTGALLEHFIPLNQTIEYQIRFQNTGTDTAFTVIVRDTLDADLDASSLRPLGSSHPYTFNLSGENVAQFVFANLLLPDSNVNEPASHGYLKFSIAPKKDILNGTLVENEAAIFFDFNDPIITNKTWHTLGEQYLDISNVVFNPEIELETFPNPSSDLVNFLIKSASPVRGTLRVFDVNGRMLVIQEFDRNQFVLNTKELKAGCFFFSICTETQTIATGKIVLVEK